MPRTHLLALPTELLAEICRNLRWHCQLEDDLFKRPSGAGTESESDDEHMDSQWGLLNLVSSCRTLRAIAEPFLYHYSETASESSDRPCAFYFFLRTLETRPDLAANVRQVILDSQSLLPLQTGLPSSEVDTQDMDALEKRLREEGVFPCDGGKAGSAILLSVLFELAPNLQTLRVSMYGEEDLYFPPDINASVPLLRSLKHLALTIDFGLSNFDHAHPLEYSELILRITPKP
jgi:hypothetical protein